MQPYIKGGHLVVLIVRHFVMEMNYPHDMYTLRRGGRCSRMKTLKGA